MDIKKVKVRKRGRKHRGITSRKFFFFLLSLGIMGVFIGVLLTGIAFLQGKPKLSMMGLIYIAVFIAVLFIRVAIIQYSSAGKSRYATKR